MHRNVPCDVSFTNGHWPMNAVASIRRWSALALAGLFLLSCGTGAGTQSPAERTAGGTVTHAGIMDEVTIGGSVTVSAGTD